MQGSPSGICDGKNGVDRFTLSLIIFKAVWQRIAMSTLMRFHLPLALSIFHTACVHGMPFSACHGHMPQPVLTCASVVVQLVTSVDGEFDGGI